MSTPGRRRHARHAAVPDRVAEQPAARDHRHRGGRRDRTEHGIVTLTDNTFATPVNQRPIALGVDLVWHSATKYLAGHSDTSAGVVVGPDTLIETIWNMSLTVGAVLGPFDAWLVTAGSARCTCGSSATTRPARSSPTT